MDDNDKQQQRQARGLKASAVKPPYHHISDHSSESTSAMDDHQIQKRNQPEEGPGTPGLGLASERPSDHIVILPEESTEIQLLAELDNRMEEKSMQDELGSTVYVNLDFQKFPKVWISNTDSCGEKQMVTEAMCNTDLSIAEEQMVKGAMCNTDLSMEEELNREGLILKEEMCNTDLSTEKELNSEDPPILQQTDTGYMHPVGPWGHALSVKKHETNKDMDLLRAAYLMKGDDLRKILEKNSVWEEESPLGNTVLHMAASCGNIEAAECVTQEAPNLLRAKNSNGDTALHVAARAGNISVLRKLLATYFHQNSAFGKNILSQEVYEDMKSMASSQNEQGNTFLHEALKSSKGMIFQVLEAPLAMNNEENSLRTSEAIFKIVVKEVASSITNNEGKAVLYLAIEAGYEDVVNGLLDHDLSPPIFGKSPLLGAIMKRNREMLETILRKKPAWIHLMDSERRTPLHYAASIGYFEGVCYLLGKCKSCAIERDKYGFYPLHLASDGGHVEVIDKLLECCSGPPENIVDESLGRNILHIAAKSGKLNVVNYILRTPKLRTMINQKDAKGNTPLHLASLRCHPRIVHVLTWDKMVDPTLTNKKNQTALDAMKQKMKKNPPLSQRLTWSALKSAGIKISPQGTPSSTQREAANLEKYNDRIETYIVVSTLIITATFAAGFTMPGGNGSDPEPGMANMINHSMFHLFILSNTISLYGAISVTIILILSRLKDLGLMIVALEVAMPLLGVTLVTLSLTFLAGVYLVISKLSWLANTFMIVSAVFVPMIVLLYSLLLFPSTSSHPVKRHLSYYPFIVFAKVAERESKGKRNGSITFSAYT